MYTKTTERMSIGSKTSEAEAIAADITATIALMKSCNVSGDSHSDTNNNTTTISESKATPTIDIDVDTATNEPAQPSEKMEIDLSISERKDVKMSDCAPRPQHKRLAHLAGVEARARALSLQHKTLAPCMYRSRPLGLRSAAGQRQSRLASAAMQILETVGDLALTRDIARDEVMGGGEE
jgi:hypothetical protein